MLHFLRNVPILIGNLYKLGFYMVFGKLFNLPPMVGGIRPTEVYLPANYDPSVPAPLFTLLHGYGLDRDIDGDYFKMHAATSKVGMIFLMPNGIRNAVGSRFWNATDACCDIFANGRDDSKWIIGLVDEVSARYKIDQDRIYFAGHSNGGFMSHRMACDHSDRIAGIMALAG